MTGGERSTFKGEANATPVIFQEPFAMSRSSLSQWAALSAAFAWMVFSGIETASAQSLFGSSGTTSRGTSSMAGTQYGSGSGTIRSTSPTSGFSNSFGSTSAAGALNSGGLGGNGLNTAAGATGQAGLTGPQIATQLGALSATIGQGGFIGAADNAGRFVGNQNAGTQSLQGTSMSGTQFGGQFGGGQFGDRSQGQNGFSQQNNFNQQQNRRMIRPQQRIAFEYPQRAQESIQTDLSARFERLQTTRPELEGVEIVLAANSEVVLRGQVRTEEDKKLAAMYARMEPGVRSVRNELTIAEN
jgi:osmotically-inducible protein OsmY